MATIVTIWGWENGRPWYEWETKIIDKQIVEMTWKESVRFLFIWTASSDHEWYRAVMQKNYWELWCTTDFLPLEDNTLSVDQIEEKIKWADIIYVWGGNTKHMMEKWREKTLDVLLNKYLKSDKIYCGLSAWSICRYEKWLHDREPNEDKYEEIDGLWFIKASHEPHFEVTMERTTNRPKLLVNSGNTWIWIDNNCAIVYKDDMMKVVSSKEEANAYICKVQDWKYTETKIEKDKELYIAEILR